MNSKQVRLKKIHKGNYGNGDKYKYGDKEILITRTMNSNNAYIVPNIDSGQEIFRIYGKCDYRFFIKKLKTHLNLKSNEQ